MQVTPTIVKEAEREYSRERLESIRDEWVAQHPALDRLAVALLQGVNSSFDFAVLKSDAVRNRLVLLAASGIKPLPHGLVEAANNCVPMPAFLGNAVIALATAGVLLVKPSPTEPYATGPEDMKGIHCEQLEDATGLRVHPTFYRALSVRA